MSAARCWGLKGIVFLALGFFNHSFFFVISWMEGGAFAPPGQSSVEEGLKQATTRTVFLRNKNDSRQQHAGLSSSNPKRLLQGD